MASTAYSWWRRTVLALTGGVHLLPLLGMAGAAALQRAYGIRLDDPAVELLLRHRALMFGLLGAALLTAAWTQRGVFAALLVGLCSVGGFLLLSIGVDLPAPLQTVWWIDLMLLPLLLSALPGRSPDRPDRL